MDETDRRLMVLLAENPRIPYRELADKLGISVQAVHRRIQLLMKAGVLRGLTAGISIRYLNAVPVIVFGRSNALSADETAKKLSANELSSSVLVAGGNLIYAVALLKSISDLEKYVDFVKRTAEISEPTVGIYSTDAGLAPDFIDGGKRVVDRPSTLTPLDVRIIKSLQPDCRKPVADIAKEVGVSSRTVSRRLQKMIDEGSIDLVIPMDPTCTGDIVSLVHVVLNEGASKKDVGARFLNRYSPRVWYLRSFTNMPNFLLCVVCTDTMTELREILGEIAKDKAVKSIVPNIWYSDHIFETWRDKMVSLDVGRAKAGRSAED
jgi:DNA-binding Lrp family transcriptional regulator